MSKRELFYLAIFNLGSRLQDWAERRLHALDVPDVARGVAHLPKVSDLDWKQLHRFDAKPEG